MSDQPEAKEDRVYINLQVEINGERGEVTREVLINWPGREADPRLLLQEVFSEMDSMLAMREAKGGS